MEWWQLLLVLIVGPFYVAVVVSMLSHAVFMGMLHAFRHAAAKQNRRQSNDG